MAEDWIEGNAYASEAERRDRDHRTLPPDATATVGQRRRLLIGLVIVALVLAAGFVALDRAGDDAVSEARPIDAVEPAGGGLAVTWTGTACDRVDAGRTEVVETADAVTVTLYVHVPIDTCDGGEDVTRTHEVPLDQPLGTREVDDGACHLPGLGDELLCGRGPGLH